MASLVPFSVVALPQRVAWSASLPARIAPGDEGFDTLAEIGTAVDPADQVVVRSLRIDGQPAQGFLRSEEHTSELQSLMRNSYAVFCLKKKKTRNTQSRQ